MLPLAMNNALRYGLIGVTLLSIGCVKKEKLVDPLGVWQCNGYESVRYVTEDSSRTWTGNAWEWTRSYRVDDSTANIKNLQITVREGSDNTMMVTNLVKKADSTVNGPASWDHIDEVSLAHYVTDSLNNQKIYRLWLPGLHAAPGVTIILYYDYKDNVIHLSYESYIKGSYGSNLGSTVYLVGKKG